MLEVMSASKCNFACCSANDEAGTLLVLEAECYSAALRLLRWEAGRHTGWHAGLQRHSCLLGWLGSTTSSSLRKLEADPTQLSACQLTLVRWA